MVESNLIENPSCESDCNPLSGCDVCCPPQNHSHIWGRCPECNSTNIDPDYGHAVDFDQEAYQCNACDHWWVKT